MTHDAYLIRISSTSASGQYNFAADGLESGGLSPEEVVYRTALKLGLGATKLGKMIEPELAERQLTELHQRHQQFQIALDDQKETVRRLQAEMEGS